MRGIFVNENLCNRQADREERLLKIVSSNSGRINGGSSVSITRSIIYQETSNNYCCLAHILYRAACNIVSSSTCLHCTRRRFVIFLAPRCTGRYLSFSFFISFFFCCCFRYREYFCTFSYLKNNVMSDTWRMAKCNDVRSWRVDR